MVATAQLQLHEEELPRELLSGLGPHLARQRWYAGAGSPASVEVEQSGCLAELASGGRLLWAVATVGVREDDEPPGDGSRDAPPPQVAGDARDSYQLVLAERPDREAAELAAARTDTLMASALVATVGGKTYYDATVDPEMSLALLEVASGGAEHAKRARPLGVEQSNSSVVYDDRVILKLFRRLSPGPNPDAEVTSSLAQAGFSHVAAPVLRWRKDQTDLAFGQQYLAGGADGWALALTSLRDLYSPAKPSFGANDNLEDEDATRPGLQGGDFAAEAARLGRVTAEMHISMAGAFGTSGDWCQRWQQLRESLNAQIATLVPELAAASEPLFQRLGEVADLGPALRGHGDYHLGQVMRTDAGWYVLDFEGEPNRPLEERLSPASTMKDVAGMLRSFHYAAYFAIAERGPAAASPELEGLAQAWEERNRAAFMRGYLGYEGIDELLPGSPEDRGSLCLAFEVEKALYELSYERAFRPAWAGIPMDALHRLLAGPLEEMPSLSSRPHGDAIDLEAREHSGGRLG